MAILKNYKWVYYDWFNCTTFMLGTKKEAKAKFKKMRKKQPSMNYHHLQRLGLLSDCKTD